nr:soluble calcium-activated nucleotidase 1 [Leptinotarsa decemlineata]
MESTSLHMHLLDEEEMVVTRDWRKALKAQPAYRIVNRTIRGQTLFVYIVGLTGVFFLIYLYSNSSKRSNTSILRSGDYNYTYPLTRPIRTSNMHTFRIGIIADLDTDSLKKNEKNTWISFFKTGHLNYNPHKHSVVITWDLKDPEVLKTNYALKGRGLELSELVTFDGKLLTFDDRTGLVLEIVKNDVIPWVILMDGDGKSKKGFKSEWATVKDELLYVGSMGKEWTTASGEFENNNPQYIKTVTNKGQVSHISWIAEYRRIREVLGIKWPGYMIHESGVWSNEHQRWFFLPRRCSKEPYNESLDEHRGCSVLISADPQMYDVTVVKVIH